MERGRGTGRECGDNEEMKREGKRGIEDSRRRDESRKRGYKEVEVEKVKGGSVEWRTVRGGGGRGKER